MTTWPKPSVVAPELVPSGGSVPGNGPHFSMSDDTSLLAGEAVLTSSSTSATPPHAHALRRQAPQPPNRSPARNVQLAGTCHGTLSFERQGFELRRGAGNPWV